MGLRGARRDVTGPGWGRGDVLAALLGAVVVGVGLGVPLALLSGLESAPRPGPRGSLSPQPDQAVAHLDAPDSVAITIPRSWTFESEPTQPIEPENVLAVGSWRFPVGGVCAPFAALRDLPKDGAFLWLIEYHGTQHPDDFVDRPEPFDLGEFRFGREYSCDDVVPQYQLRFRQSDRYFQLQIALGTDASSSVEAEVLRALDSIRVFEVTG
jgi:hypothetical protein